MSRAVVPAVMLDRALLMGMLVTPIVSSNHGLHTPQKEMAACRAVRVCLMSGLGRPYRKQAAPPRNF